ncbi:hypothetical protein DFJ74DRAFT_518007 [Hyaloraphidium curvatum]|nr:hypothetical protein DFJ74DRAFT_518007 [Hyaloraphidium curvatum]
MRTSSGQHFNTTGWRPAWATAALCTAVAAFFACTVLLPALPCTAVEPLPAAAPHDDLARIWTALRRRCKPGSLGSAGRRRGAGRPPADGRPRGGPPRPASSPLAWRSPSRAPSCCRWSRRPSRARRFRTLSTARRSARRRRPSHPPNGTRGILWTESTPYGPAWGLRLAACGPSPRGGSTSATSLSPPKSRRGGPT